MSSTPAAASRGAGLGLLDRAANAVPAAVEEIKHGWRLRWVDSTIWWAGACLAHSGSADQILDPAIRVVEGFYSQRGGPARFQVCPECPAGLDATLAARGYRWTTPMNLQVASAAPIADRLRAAPFQVRIDDQVTDQWFAVWHAVHAPDADPQPEWRLLRRVERPSGYVSVLSAGQPVAVGRAVAERGWIGVFGMATLPIARRQGAGSAVLAGLARWAADHHVEHLYLQIEDDNPAARHLYAGAGFATVLRYHYRTAELVAAP